MKFNFLLIAALCVLGSSCTKDLDLTPESSATAQVFYGSVNDFQQATNAVYSGLQTYPNRALDLYETRSDNVYGVSDDGKRYWDPINNLSPDLADKSVISSAWANNYNGIFKANTLLEQLNKNGDAVLTPALKSRLEAEGRFLRAFYYFDLIRLFGRVPLIDKVVTAAEITSIPRAEVENAYALIIADLEFAAANLPENYGATEAGHATKYAAKGILAQVYMTRSGPTYNVKGPGMGTTEWTKAGALLDEIIASGKYRLLNTYNSIFAYDNESNAEVVFDIQYISGGLGLGGEFPSLLLPDRYVQQVAGFAGGVMVRPPSASLLASYPTGDKRSTFSIQNGYTIAGGATDSRPLLVKFLNVSKKGTRWTDWPLNFIVLRYTDVLMLKAECILHDAAGSQSDVDKIVNDVRTRAGISPLANVNLDVLLAERQREFIGEGIRWHDLVRSGNVVALMNDWISKDDNQKAINTMKPEFVIYPVPQNEINIVPGLYEQNSGYN